MRKYLIMILCLSIFFSFSVAEETDKKTVMTLDEAVSYAAEHNANIIDIKLKQKDQKDAYEDAKRENTYWKNKIRNGGGYSFEEPIDYLEYTGDALITAELTYNKFLANQKATIEGIKYGVKNMAFSIVETEKTISCLEENIKKQENDVQIAEVKLGLNMITGTDLTNTKLTLEETKSKLQTLKNSLITLKTNLKKTMGFDVSKELVVTLPEIKNEELKVENIDETIEESLNTNINVITAKAAYKTKENNYKIATETHFLETKDEIRTAKNEFADALTRRENEINAEREKIKVLYETVKNSWNELNSAKETYETSKKQFEQAKIMYDLGLVSKNAFLGYEVGMFNAENTYNSVKNKNVLLTDEWNMALACGYFVVK